jgi:hypothetical protein
LFICFYLKEGVLSLATERLPSLHALHAGCQAMGAGHVEQPSRLPSGSGACKGKKIK